MREFITLLFIFSGTIFILLSIPLRKKKIAPNYFYGLRTRATLNNPDVWYQANKISANYMKLVGWLVIATAIVCYFVKSLSFEWVGGINVAVILIGVIWMAIASYRLANKLERKLQKAD